jgi:dTDP-4-amino-4,6-dideoxygalactose transaminase
MPVHLQLAYKGCVRLWDGCVGSDKAAAEALSLPLYPELADDQVQIVC